MRKMYIVQVQGWGDREDEFYNMGACSTPEQAKALVEELLVGWEEDGQDRADVVYEIEEIELV